MKSSVRFFKPGEAPGGKSPKTMTIGALSRRTGVPVKTLREYEDLGLIYTVGRSAGNYRLFDDDALWCVAAVGTMRQLGLTLAEMRELAETYLGKSGQPIGPRLAALLAVVRTRTKDRISELRLLLQRIEEFEAAHEAELTGREDFRAYDPRSRQGT